MRAPVRQPRSAAPGKALVVRLLAVSVLLMAGTMGAGVAKASPGAPRAASADESPPPPPRLSAGPLRVPEPQLEQPDSALEDPDEIAQPGVEDDLPAERSIEIVALQIRGRKQVTVKQITEALEAEGLREGERIFWPEDPRIDRASERLASTGYFDQVALRLVPVSDRRDQAALVIDIHERSSLIVRDIHAQGSRLTPFAGGFDLMERNLAGRSVHLGGGFVVGTPARGVEDPRRQQAYKLYTELPVVAGTPIGVAASAYAILANEPYRVAGLDADPNPANFDTVRYDRFGGVVGVTVPFSADLQLGIDFRFEAIDARLAALTAVFTRAGRPELDPVPTLLTPTRARIRAGMPDAGGQDFVRFADEAQAELDRILAEADLTEVLDAEVGGTALLAYRGVNRITHTLRRSFAGVFAVVVVVIGLLLRSLPLTLLGLLPNLLPLLLGYALVGLLGVPLDPLAAVILTLTLGVAVDDTLHILVRTREEIAADKDADSPTPALRRAMHHSGRAVAVTSLLIAGGLALNLGSSFPPLQMLGLLGAVIITLALLADLLLLPALLSLAGVRALR
ncbi:MAG: MMPL family transporter [Myxococcales bacterium]|nr:MMPL family transporter [Myxococcales bacterium]